MESVCVCVCICARACVCARVCLHVRQFLLKISIINLTGKVIGEATFRYRVSVY